MNVSSGAKRGEFNEAHKEAKKIHNSLPDLNIIEERIEEQAKNNQGKTGLNSAGLDFIIDSEGQPWLIEINTIYRNGLDTFFQDGDAKGEKLIQAVNGYQKGFSSLINQKSKINTEGIKDPNRLKPILPDFLILIMNHGLEC